MEQKNIDMLETYQASSLSDIQYNVLLDVLGDLFDVIFFYGVFVEIR